MIMGYLLIILCHPIFVNLCYNIFYIVTFRAIFFTIVLLKATTNTIRKSMSNVNVILVILCLHYGS